VWRFAQGVERIPMWAVFRQCKNHVRGGPAAGPSPEHAPRAIRAYGSEDFFAFTGPGRRSARKL